MAGCPEAVDARVRQHKREHCPVTRGEDEVLAEIHNAIHEVGETIATVGLHLGAILDASLKDIWREVGRISDRIEN